MKELTVLLITVLLCNQISGYFIKIPTKSTAEVPVKDHSQWLYRQKLMLPLFENVCETSKDPNICEAAENFKLEPTNYINPEVIKNLQNLISTGLLPKGEIFSEYQPNHLNELKVIYEVFYNAKDFDTFYKVTTWARQNLNCVLYVNALYTAIQTRKDTGMLYIPPPYELLPNYFIDQNVIIQAAKLLEKDYNSFVVSNETVHNDGISYVIDANYTSMFYDNEEDSKLAYFREDIGLNSYYYLRKLKMAPWLNDDVNERFGEDMYQMMKQLMARYNLERYANGLPEVNGINWDEPIDVPYNPMLIYSDGDEFNQRTSPIGLSKNDDELQLQTIENNISAVVEHLYQRGYNKTLILNHLMEILVTGNRSYETLSRQLLGANVHDKRTPSVLDHYMTSLRDPIFWEINSKIVHMIDDALKILPTYTRDELLFPGVEIVSIDVKKAVTTFDYFTFDVTDALQTENIDFRVKIGQPRLNQKQFSIKINITSLVSQKGTMKIYLGPNIMPGELATKKHLFTLLDICQVNLKIGSNIITRSPENMNLFSEDFVPLNTLRKKVQYADFGFNLYVPKTIHSQVGFPSRLLLPKGATQGLPLQIFVFVAPNMNANIDQAYSVSNYKLNNAILSPGYPLDLNIHDRQLFELPNALIKHFTVTQKGDSKVENYGGPGVTKSLYTINTYDSAAGRPSYSSNKPQYGDKPVYPSKNYRRDDISNEYNPGEDNITDNDNNIMQTIENAPNLYKQSEYLSEREPFDYKAKKAQYDKKDYSVNRSYTNYSTMPKNENNIVTSTNSSEIGNSLEEYVTDILDHNNVGKNTSPQDLNEDSIREIKNPTAKGTPHEDFIAVETLPVPLMLNKDFDEGKFDYKVKKTERKYKLKEKKALLDKLIKQAKLKLKSKKVTVKGEETLKIGSDENIYQDSPVYYTKNYKNDFDSNDFHSEGGEKENYVNRMSKIENTPHLQVGYVQRDYPSKREPFDYKAKKAQYNKKDYSANRNYTKYHSIQNKEQNIVTSITPSALINNTDEYLMDSFNHNNTSINSFDQENDHNLLKEIKTPVTKETREDFLEIEPLPVPAMLKEDINEEKYDYKVKKTERKYKVKEKKTQLDKIIKDAKLKHKIKNVYDDMDQDAEELKGQDVVNNIDKNIKKTDSKDTHLQDQIGTTKPIDSDESTEVKDFIQNYILFPDGKSDLQKNIISSEDHEDYSKKQDLSVIQKIADLISKRTFIS